MEPAVDLDRALYILAQAHTRDDGDLGFTVEAGAAPWNLNYDWSREEYIDAWKAVRKHLHMQTASQR